MNIKQLQEGLVAWIKQAQYYDKDYTVNLKGKHYTIKLEPIHTNNRDQELYSFEEVKRFYNNYSSKQVKEMYQTKVYPSILQGYYNNTPRAMTAENFEDLHAVEVANVFLKDMEKVK